MNDREKDAKLHELIYGVPVEWHVCKLEKWGFSDVSNFYDNDSVRMAKYTKWANQLTQGYSMQPCMKNDDSPFWQVVPNYTSDVAAAWKIEGDLCDVLLDEHLVHLATITAPGLMNDREQLYALMKALRRAAPAQIVDALLLTFGVQP